MRNSRGCPGVCLTLWKHRKREFDGVITRLRFHHLCGWICYQRGGGGSAGTPPCPLCHRPANCSGPCLLFITKMQTLRCLFLFFTEQCLLWPMIRVLLFLPWPRKYRLQKQRFSFQLGSASLPWFEAFKEIINQVHVTSSLPLENVCFSAENFRKCAKFLLATLENNGFLVLWQAWKRSLTRAQQMIKYKSFIL